jgi:hypothetical protein
MSDNSEIYTISLKDVNFMAGMKAAGTASDVTKAKVEGVGGAVGGIGVALAALGILSFGATSVKAWDESEKAIAQVRQGILTTGGAAGKTLEDLTATASKLQNDTIFGDDEILQKVTAQLLTFGNVAGTQFDRAQVAAVDLATRLGGDLQSASIQLGKALENPTKGVSALSKSGISFSDAQKGMIKHLQETNQLAKAQDLILSELERQYGGSAAAAAAAGMGGMQQLANAFNDTEEQIGSLIYSGIDLILPALRGVNSLISDFVGWVTSGSTSASTFITIIGGLAGGFLAYGLIVGGVAAYTGIATAAQWLFNAAMTANPIGLVVMGLAALSVGLVIAYNKFEGFRAMVDGSWAVLKNVGTNIYDMFSKLPDMVINSFTRIPAAISTTFSGVGDLFNAIFGDGDMSDIPKILKGIGGGILKANPVTGLLSDVIGEATKGSGAAYDKAHAKSLTDSKADKAKKEREKFVNAKGAGLGAKAGKKDDSLGAGISEIKASAPKIFNINIENLVKEMNFKTQNITESASKIKEALTNAMLTAVNDSQIIAE